MATHNDLGKFGEEQAEKHLISYGYTILAKNYRYQKAEIDLIAQKGNTVAIVEVKTRKNKAFGAPELFVNNKKIKLLVKATQAFVEERALDVDIRFDIIAVTIEPRIAIEHIEDAYYHF